MRVNLAFFVLVGFCAASAKHANPYVVRVESPNESRTDLVVLMDDSGSISSRQMHQAIKFFKKVYKKVAAKESTKMRVGIVKFSDVAKDVLPLTDATNTNAINTGFEALAHRTYGGTDIKLGLIQAMDMLNQAQGSRRKVIVLVTDGNGGVEWWTPVENADVTLVGVGIGSFVDKNLKSHSDWYYEAADFESLDEVVAANFITFLVREPKNVRKQDGIIRVPLIPV